MEDPSGPILSRLAKGPVEGGELLEGLRRLGYRMSPMELLGIMGRLVGSGHASRWDEPPGASFGEVRRIMFGTPTQAEFAKAMEARADTP